MTSVLDARGKTHRIIEKEPILFAQIVTADSPFRFEFSIAAEMQSMDGHDVSVSFKHGVATTDGVGGVTMSSEDVIWH